jgi:hypothetical protein
MYLSVRKYVERLVEDEPQKPRETDDFRDLLRITDTADIVEVGGYTGASVEIPVYYWRKANSIHKWFVDNLADGVDNCQPIEFEPKKLEGLLANIKAVLDSPRVASKKMPTSSGFFFGSEDYSEWYFDTLKTTYDDLSALLESLKKKGEGKYWLVYLASW